MKLHPKGFVNLFFERNCQKNKYRYCINTFSNICSCYTNNTCSCKKAFN